MTKKPVSGEIKTAFERELKEPLPYATEAEQFDTPAEVKEAGEWPNDKTIVTMVNQRMVAAARQAAITAALAKAGIKAPTLEDTDEAVKNIAKSLLAQKKVANMDEAIARAKSVLGMDE